MKKILFIAALMLILPVLLAAQSGSDELFTKGRDDFAAKSYDSAVSSFETFLKAYPEDPRADGVNYMRAVSYFYLKKYIQSIDAFNLFRDRYSDSAYNSRVSYWLGLCNYALKDFDRAAENFLKQTEYRDESFFLSRSYLYLGESYEKSSRPGLAMEAYKQCIVAGGEEKIVSQSRLKLGILYFNSGNYSAASDQFAGIINNSIDTELVSDSQFYIGESLYYMGNLSDAASKLQFYLFMSSNNKFREAAVFRLGDIYQSLGKTAEAVKYLQLLKSDYPGGKYYLDGLRVLGRTWKAAGEYEKAEDVYREIISLSTDKYEIQSYYYEMAMGKVDTDKPLDAVPLLRESAKGPDSEKEMMSLYYLGQILMNQGREEEGSAYLFDLSSRFQGTGAADDASVTLADYLIGKGDKHRLALFIGSQLNRDSKYIDRFLFIKGGLDEEESNYTEALMAYDRIIGTYPDSSFLSPALHRKAGIFVNQGKRKEAVALYDEALKAAKTEADRTDILVDKALLLYDMGNMEQADYAFTILLQKDVDFDRKGEILYRQGELSLEKRNYADAAEYFRRAAEATTGDSSIDALFKMARSYFHLLNYRTSERIYTDLAEKLSSTSDRKMEAMKMNDLSIFLQQDWNRTLQYSDLMVTSLGVFPREIRLIKILSLFALGRTDAFDREVASLGDGAANRILKESMLLIRELEPSTVMLIFRSLLSAYPEEPADTLTVMLMTDLMYIVADREWIARDHEKILPLLNDEVLKIGFEQAFKMNSPAENH